MGQPISKEQVASKVGINTRFSGLGFWRFLPYKAYARHQQGAGFMVVGQSAPSLRSLKRYRLWLRPKPEFAGIGVIVRNQHRVFFVKQRANFGDNRPFAGT